MKILRIIAMGLRGLLGKPLRTALSALGIVIGVASVVALTSLGNGIRDSVSGQITDLGPNIVTVSPGSESADGGGAIDAEMVSTLTPQDTRNVAALPSVKAASSNAATGAFVDGKGVQLSGVDPSYDEVRKVELASGRFVEGGGEIVLSHADAEKLFGGKPEGAVGKTLPVGGSARNVPEGLPPEQAQDSRQERPVREYEVVGVVASQPEGGLVQAASAVSYVTTADALELSGSETVGQILVAATGAGAVGEAKAGIASEIRAAHGGQEDFTVETQEELLSTFSQITDQLNVFLAGIAGISLLVGGIGIMNIMLVSVAERTREIGVRKALGATDGDVLLQFLFEAVLLATLGGLAGVALGVGSSVLLPVLISDLPAAAFATTQIALAFGVSALIGVLFGVVPAYRSARLAPVEALRRE
ncbi:FtsX-like permease family protein [Rubrobacter marinus]|uniref:FtsX-like permease family protein n=1 Tax=Rubrobacter marinus TaxID=2653852 RepID=A0A6G8PU03_9ACTN|nr:ABC transporter permease [Rubrobacter marinus]QIN77436.1 FtsX-like permease family protein [Rubrobacter marinus]